MMKMKFFLTLVVIGVFLFAATGSDDTPNTNSSEGYGEYHNLYTGERQSSYKGSIEQQQELIILDKMIEEGY